jgi:DNA invertase Pin-like site-specific DNA recombinase
MTSRIEMTCQELWELVWSMPLNRAAATFPMSHLALKRLCERHQIPLPPLGHWLKNAERQRQDRLPLPNGHLGQQRIWVRRFLRRRAPNHRSLAMQPAQPAEATGGAATFQHECTRRTSAILERARPNSALQRRELMQACEHRGWEVVEVYEDAGVSGAKGREGRPAFDRLCQDATRRRFDVIAAWSVDRLGFLSDTHGAGVNLYLHQQAVDTTTPAGRALFQMMGVFAKFERTMIRDRVKAGLANAQAKGVRLGAPRTDAEVIARIAREKAKGLSVRAIAAKLGVGAGTVHRVLNGGHVSQSGA